MNSETRNITDMQKERKEQVENAISREAPQYGCYPPHFQLTGMKYHFIISGNFSSHFSVTITVHPQRWSKVHRRLGIFLDILSSNGFDFEKYVLSRWKSKLDWILDELVEMNEGIEWLIAKIGEFWTNCTQISVISLNEKYKLCEFWKFCGFIEPICTALLIVVTIL